MATCGKKYAEMVVTAGSGYTPENPYDLFATPYDYAEWRNLAHRLAVKARTHLDRLQAADKTREQTEESNALVDQYNATAEAVDALPGLLGGTWAGVVLEQSISQAVGISQDAACLMQSIDQQLSEAGIKPPDEPGGRSPKTKPLDLTGLLNVAVIAGVGYLGYRVMKGTGGL